MESRKIVLMILLEGNKEYTHRHKEQTFGHRREGEGGMIWESNIKTYTLPCVKWMAVGICYTM